VYYALSVVTGMIVSVMIMINGMFANHSGVYTSTVVIHITGLIAITLYMIFKKEFRKLFKKKVPFYLYLGGVIGVLTILFNNLAFSKIDISALLALTLLGQSVASLIVDHYGFLGMKKVKFTSKKFVGITFVLIGVCFMISFDKVSQFIPIILSFFTGITIVFSRTVNGKLAVETSVHESTWHNYFFGSIVSIVVLSLFQMMGLNEPALVFTGNPLIYTGGLVGTCAVFLTTMCVSKISSFYMTLLLFAGQIFTGIIIDIIISQSFSIRNLVGGIVITAGLALDMIVNREVPVPVDQKGR
jgi:transporter family-2 protein